MQDIPNKDVPITPVTRPDVEQCAHCGQSVKWGSGRFVNRVPIFNRDDSDPHPCIYSPYEGDFICEECDAMDSDTV